MISKHKYTHRFITKTQNYSTNSQASVKSSSVKRFYDDGHDNDDDADNNDDDVQSI